LSRNKRPENEVRVYVLSKQGKTTSEH